VHKNNLFGCRLHNPTREGTRSTVLNRPQGYVVPTGADVSIGFDPELIRPGSFSGYQQKAPSSLEHWHFHLLRREEVSPEAQPRQEDREGKGEYLGGFPESSRFTITLRKTD
jgi:hypothetical protein